MRILVDITEPGSLYRNLAWRCQRHGIKVERSMLHKRKGSGPSLRANHPLYGEGGDYVIVDDEGVPAAAFERKRLDDLAKSALSGSGGTEPRIFRQLRDLLCYPTPILLLEGLPSATYRKIEPAILGLQLWCSREGVTIVYASDAASSVRAIELAARRLANELEAPNEAAAEDVPNKESKAAPAGAAPLPKPSSAAPAGAAPVPSAPKAREV